jgi:peptidoglycan hydrolase-like protein with peptidoglycan-binding domain
MYHIMNINYKFSSFLILALLWLSPGVVFAQYMASDMVGHLDINGDPDFTANELNNNEGAANSRGNRGIYGVTIDSVNHRLFAADVYNNRILVFNLDSENNFIDRTADYVLGQPDFTTVAARTTQDGLNIPVCQAYDSVRDRLFVCDAVNRRVVVFDTSIITNGMNASYVLGKSDFITGASMTTQNGMGTAFGAAYDEVNDRLFVKDRSNSRILVFDTSSVSNGMNASYVIGQSDFISSTEATTQSGLRLPQGDLAYDSVNNRLFVADSDNARVLIFDVTPSNMSNGMDAEYVLGQTDFVSSASATTQNGLAVTVNFSVYSVAYDSVNNLLYVVDSQNNRVLGFDVSPATISNNENAFVVIGQEDFTSDVFTVTQTNFKFPWGLAFDSTYNRIYVGEGTAGGANNNNRVMVFDLIRITTTSLPVSSVVVNTLYTTHTLATTNSQGTVSYEVTEGSLPTGLSLNTTTGEISGIPTVVGSYEFTVQATDDNGSIGYFLSQPQEYTLEVVEPARSSSGSRKKKSSPVELVPEQSSISLLTSNTVSSTPSACTITTSILKLNSRGIDVSCLQSKLNTLLTINLVTDGIFGPLTKAAVVNFQIRNNLIPDGIVGPVTKEAMR